MAFTGVPAGAAISIPVRRVAVLNSGSTWRPKPARTLPATGRGVPPRARPAPRGGGHPAQGLLQMGAGGAELGRRLFFARGPRAERRDQVAALDQPLACLLLPGPRLAARLGRLAEQRLALRPARLVGIARGRMAREERAILLEDARHALAPAGEAHEVGRGEDRAAAAGELPLVERDEPLLDPALGVGERARRLVDALARLGELGARLALALVQELRAHPHLGQLPVDR